MLTDNQIRSYLEDHYKIACDLAGLSAKSGAIKLMGKKKKEQNKSIKSGYYVRLQNFDTLREAKKSMSDRNVRYIIRCIQFRNRKEPLLEIAKWHPSFGKVENTKTIYRDDKDGRNKGDFTKHFANLIYWCHYKL